MLNLTDRDFYTLFGAALAQPDLDTYIAEQSSSTIFYPTPDAPDLDTVEMTDTLTRVWRVAHISIKEIRSACGLTQAAFGVRYCIPKRTVENWEMRGGCPDYVRLLLAEAAGLIQR